MMDRRQLKREYKESHRPMGVYRVRNKEDDKSLVAGSVNLPATFNRLRMELEAGTFRRYPQLQQDWQRLGAEAFEFEVLEELDPSDAPGWDPSDDLGALEEIWLEELSPYDDRGYNRRPRTS